jgi:dGTPase
LRRSKLESAFKELLADLFPVEQPYSGIASQRAALRNLTGSLIGRYITGVVLMLQQGQCRLQIDQNLKDEIFMLKELTWTYVIEAPSLASQQHGQRKIIAGLFSEYSTAATDKGKQRNLAIFPPYYQERLRAAGDDDERKRICVDLVAGMTEKQAIATYLRLTGVSLGSGLEELLS